MQNQRHMQNPGIFRTEVYPEPSDTQNPVKHLRWSIVQKLLTELFLQIIIIFAISAFHILYFLKFNNPVDTGHKLNVLKMFRRHLGSILNVLGMFNLCPVSTRKGQFFAPKVFIICKKAQWLRGPGIMNFDISTLCRNFLFIIT